MTCLVIYWEFYDAERAKIVEPIHWVLDTSLAVEARSRRLVSEEEDELVVFLRRVPLNEDVGFMVAHELMGFVLDCEGFPSVGTSPSFQNIGSALNSIVWTPLRDSRLKKYGFDLLGDYEKRTDEALRQLDAITQAPSEFFLRTQWIFYYVQHILYWEDVLRGNRSDNEYQSFFAKKFPDIAEEGEELVTLVRDIGYDTPSQMKTLFETIISKYGLTGVMRI